MKRLSLLVLALSGVLVLSACGGGGSGSPSGSSMMGPTPTETWDALVAISDAADTLYLTDVVVPTSSRLIPGERLHVGCFEDRCRYEVADASVIVTAADFGTDFDADDLRLTSPRHGIPTGQAEGRETEDGVTVDYRTYGGWLTGSIFGYTLGTYQEPATLDGLQALYAFSLGTASGSNPITGSATWTGLMLGTHQARPTQAIQGRAEAVYQFADQTLDVSMTQLTRGYADMRWQNIDVQGGRFQTFAGMGSGTDYLWGSFYGANHEEVGGTFERAGIVGAFGAKR